MKTKNLILIIVIVVLLGLAGWAYWYFLMGPDKMTAPTTPTNTTTGFKPLNRPGTVTTTTSPRIATTTSIGGGTVKTLNTSKSATLRLLSSTPVGGYGATTTATTTVVRWVDRGRGNTYEASYDNQNITTLSNTVVPKIYSSVWNRNLTAFVASMFEDGVDVTNTVYTTIIPQTSGAQATPYELRGKNITGKIIDYTSSPDKNKLFILINESGNGVGYVSSFDGKGMTKIFTTPITSLVVDWPSDNVITVTTKASANYLGYSYFVNPKTGAWKKVLGPKAGLTAITSHDGKYVLYSSVEDGAITTNILNVATGSSTDALIKTLADKCTWGNTFKNRVYCAAPSQTVSGVYPDDWYIGRTSSIDKMWSVSASTGELRLLPSIVDQADRVIDAYHLSIDAKDDHLFFINKNDLSLWSLDISKSR